MTSSVFPEQSLYTANNAGIPDPSLNLSLSNCPPPLGATIPTFIFLDTLINL